MQCPCRCSHFAIDTSSMYTSHSLLFFFVAIIDLSQFIEPSAVPIELAGTVIFTTGPASMDTILYDLDLRNDNVALENDEIVTITLSSPSSSRVVVGGMVNGVVYYPTATLTIQDDDCESHLYPLNH